MKKTAISLNLRVGCIFILTSILTLPAFALNFEFPGTQSIVIRNNSNETMHIHRIDLSPTYVPGVSISSSNCESVPANTTCSISVSVSAQAKPGYVTVTTDSKGSYGVYISATRLELNGKPNHHTIYVSHLASPQRFRLINAGPFDSERIVVKTRAGVNLPIANNTCQHNILFPGSYCELSINTKAAGEGAEGNLIVLNESGSPIASWPIKIR